MNVNESNFSTAGSAGAARASETARANTANRAATSGAADPSSNDDMHLSELVRSLRSLAADSPERQAQIEQLTRACATGNYRIDAQATAAAIIQDSISHTHSAAPRDDAAANPTASRTGIQGETAALDAV